MAEDARGQSFWYNEDTGETSWERPSQHMPAYA